MPLVRAVLPERRRALFVEAARFGLSPEALLESCGHALARAARDLAPDGVAAREIVVLAGAGRNGTVGLRAGRWLGAWGARVTALCVPPEDDSAAAHEAKLFTLAGGHMVAPAGARAALSSAGLVIDALVGGSLEGAPSGVVAQLVEDAQDVECVVLSLDVPTGLDAKTGRALAPALKADVTLALGLPYAGAAEASDAIGALFVADVGLPQRLLEDAGLTWAPWFSKDDPIAYGEDEEAGD